MSGSELFDDYGDETPAETPEEMAATETLPTDVEAMFREWLAGLTFVEIHSFLIGFAPLYVGLLLLGLPGVAPGISNGMLGLSLALGGVVVLGRSAGSRKLVKQIRMEPHYLLGGQAIAAMTGALAMALVRVPIWLAGGV